MGTVQDLVTVNGTTFNSRDEGWWRVCDVMEGWEDTADLDMILVANGNGPGAVLAATPVAKEKPLTLGGAWLAESRDSAEAAAVELRNLFPVGREVVIERAGRVAFAWLAGPVSTPMATPRGFRWDVPLLQLDPNRYSPSTLTGAAGVSTGDPIHRVYDEATYARTYDPADRARRYISTGVSGVQVHSPGDTESSRLVVTLTGPLKSGDWRVVNDATRESIRATVTFTEAQTLRLDMAAQQAWLGDQDVTSQVFGDWLTLAPGGNTFRLLAGTPDPLAGITVEAYAAWR